MQTRVLSPAEGSGSTRNRCWGRKPGRGAVERGGGQGLSLRKPDRLARGVLTMLGAARSSCSWYRAA